MGKPMGQRGVPVLATWYIRSEKRPLEGRESMLSALAEDRIPSKGVLMGVFDGQAYALHTALWRT